jgi:type IV pilus assembly protein PilC
MANRAWGNACRQRGGCSKHLAPPRHHQCTKVKKAALQERRQNHEKDIALFTRQLATMMKSGVPLLQAFDIVGRGHSNPRSANSCWTSRLTSRPAVRLSQAFRKFPLQFDNLYCNLVAAGEQAGILDTLLDRLATYKEKILAIKSKIKSALFYPIAIIVVAFVITAIIMIFVIPAFKEVFKSFGADLPPHTDCHCHF